MIIQFIGLPGAGKSRIAQELAEQLAASGREVWLLPRDIPPRPNWITLPFILLSSTCRFPGYTLCYLSLLLKAPMTIDNVPFAFADVAAETDRP